MINRFDPNFMEHPERAEALRQEAADYTDLAEYTRHIFRSNRHKKARFLIEKASDLVHPEGSLGEMRPGGGKEHGKAFFKGSLVGLRVVEVNVHEEVQDYLAQGQLARIIETTDYSNPRVWEWSASQISRECDAGYYGASGFHELISEWADQLSDNFQSQPSVAQGFGLVMRLADCAFSYDRHELGNNLADEVITGDILAKAIQSELQ